MTDLRIDIAALAKLARIDVSSEEMQGLEREVPAILGFVETIQRADVSGVEEAKDLRNVFRADADPHESGRYTERLISAAPSRDGDRIAVKQVISRKSAQGGSASERT